MTALLVNGRKIEREIEPRTHLADFVREELLLTATHLGCEQGVCGACTVLIDGAPARACLTPAVLCTGQHVQTLEGLESDPVIVALREAFSAEHALQCGYCTPGMLVTARDIVLRLPDADDARVRLELAGNLCRCTGYAGIVKAIRRVLDMRLDVERPAVEPVAITAFETEVSSPPKSLEMAARVSGRQEEKSKGDGDRLVREACIGLPVDEVWNAIRDPSFVALCVPGATLDRVDGETIEGSVLAALGPIRPRFSGSAVLRFDHAAYSGSIEGSGRDRASGTMLAGDARFRVEPDGGSAARIVISMGYKLRGPLAQFSRGPIVEAFAAELIEQTARAVESRLRGEVEGLPATSQAIGFRFLLHALWRSVRRLFGKRS